MKFTSAVATRSQKANSAALAFVFAVILLDLIGLTILSGGAGPFRPALSALLANNVPPDEQGKLNGVSAALASLMSVFGPLWAGAAYDYVTASAPFWSGAILLLLAILLLARVKAASY